MDPDPIRDEGDANSENAPSARPSGRDSNPAEPLSLPRTSQEASPLPVGESDEPAGDDPNEPIVSLVEDADLSDPDVPLQALAELEAQSSDAFLADEGPVNLSEADVERLIREIAREVSARERSSAASPAEQPSGVLLRPVQRPNTASPAAAEAGDASVEIASIAPDRPRLDPAARAVEQFAGGIFQRPQPEGAAPLPRVIVTVELANAREIMEEVREAARVEWAAMMQQIADSRIQSAEFARESERRAADWRLRR